MTQALAAILISYFKNWYHKPKYLLLFGLSGIISLLLLAFSSLKLFFFTAGIFYGIYSGSCFIYMVYHSMLDHKKAVKRVAINEFIVGAAFLAAPAIMTLLNNLDLTYQQIYIIITGIILTGLTIQYIIIKKGLYKRIKLEY